MTTSYNIIVPVYRALCSNVLKFVGKGCSDNIINLPRLQHHSVLLSSLQVVVEYNAAVAILRLKNNLALIYLSHLFQECVVGVEPPLSAKFLIVARQWVNFCYVTAQVQQIRPFEKSLRSFWTDSGRAELTHHPRTFFIRQFYHHENVLLASLLCCKVVLCCIVF